MNAEKWRRRYRQYYDRIRDGQFPLGEHERLAAQAIADGANSVRDVMRLAGLRLCVTHRAVLNLRAHGIVVPPLGGREFAGGLTIAPGYVVHRNEIFELRRVPHDPVI